MSHPTPRRSRQQAGFALFEVAVALLVLALGLLGVAKTQALVLRSTYSSGQRALVSVSAASLAAAMEGNPSYWRTVTQGSTSALSITLTPTTSGGITISRTELQTASVDCTSASCTPTQLAAYDLNAWASNLQSHLSGLLSSVTLLIQPPDATSAVNVQITVNWQENVPAINGGSAGLVTQTLTHYVQP